MPNSGGNSSSSQKGYQQIKGGGQGAHDVKTLNATETFANPDNLMCDEPYMGDQSDRQYGYPFNILDIPGNPENVDHNEGWTDSNPGPGITRPRVVAGSKDPQPGGGW